MSTKAVDVDPSKDELESAQKMLDLIFGQNSSIEPSGLSDADTNDRAIDKVLELFLNQTQEGSSGSLSLDNVGKTPQPKKQKAVKRKFDDSSDIDDSVNSSPEEALIIISCYQRSGNRATQLMSKPVMPDISKIAKTRKGMPCFRFEGSRFVPKRILIKKNNTVVGMCIHPPCDGRILVDPVSGLMKRDIDCSDHNGNAGTSTEITREKIIEDLLSSPCVVDLIKFTSQQPKDDSAA